MRTHYLPLLLVSMLALTQGCSADAEGETASGAEASSSGANPPGQGTPETSKDNDGKTSSGDGVQGGAGTGGGAIPGNGGVPGGGGSGGSWGNSGGGAGGPPQEGPAGSGGEGGTQDPELCDKTNPSVLYLSADDSNSMAGAEVARGLIEQGQLVYKGLRTHEFLNYYTFPYPPAKAGEILVSAQLHGNADGGYNLQIGVRAPDQDSAARRPYNLTLAIDTSSSMLWGPEGNSGLDRAVEACSALAGQLRQGDVISVLSWNQQQGVVLDSHVAKGPQDPAVLASCGDLAAHGATDLSAGLTQAYTLAKKNFAAERINRVILISDGGDNLTSEARTLLTNAAQDQAGEAIYLMGAGVGDPWNYNDKIMNLVTDAGRGAYVFLDTPAEAKEMFGPRLLSNLEVAARNVQVKVTLPPTLQITAFHGEQMSTNPEEVEPQHLAMGDAMIFHQELTSCDPAGVAPEAPISVEATYEDPLTREPRSALFSSTLGELLGADSALLRKGDAVVAYAEALKKIPGKPKEQALAEVAKASAVVADAKAKLAGDPELDQLSTLLATYKARLDGSLVVPGGPGQAPPAPIVPSCASCQGSGLDALRCAVDLCGEGVFLGQSYSSPTGSPTEGTWAALPRFGSSSNDLAPQLGTSYVLMASGPALGTAHSVDVGGTSAPDPFSANPTPMFNAMEWTLKLRAPANANGFSVRYVYFSEEYDDYIGSGFNDKFYVILKAGSTNSGEPTVINFTDCRDPEGYHDFICGQGLEHCEPGKRYCYVAVNAAASECCWYGGCPGGTATTSIQGTGFECAANQGQDGPGSGSSTGWLETQWPVEPNEEFELTFHVHDTGDGIFDSAALLDRLVFLQNPKPGTRQP